MIKVGINGFGRIGRQVLKAIIENHKDKLEVVAVNDLGDIHTNAHLLRYDSNYGHFPGQVEEVADGFKINGKKIKSFSFKDPKDLPWGSEGVQLVVESTGIFTSGPKAKAHIQAGAKKVIISAPATEVDLTMVLGVNQEAYDPARHHIISNASCTTNCLAPPAAVIHKNFGILKGFMTTVHSYTNDQRILDLPHKDLRRARAAALSIIPTTTGAAKAVGLVLPELKGKLDGYALRVPTPTVSVVDLTAQLSKPATTETARQALLAAAQGPMKGILQCESEPLVSMDFRGNPHSSIVDMEFTQVMDGNLLKLVAWYDNEWGYSCRVADVAAFLVDKGL
jgi:glyceraldehyde 3-phosphate dehydrogenase